MKFLKSFPLLVAACLIAGLSSTSTHVSVGGDRTLNAGAPIDGNTYINNLRTVSSSFGWADGTDDNWGDSHRTTAFKFTLATVQTVIISVARRDFVGQTGANFTLLPGFSVYQTPEFVTSTHDTGTATRAYLTGLFGTTATGESFVDENSNSVWNVGESFTDENSNGVYDGPEIGGSGKKGAFRALDPWKIFQDSITGTEMNFNSLIGHAADGTSANYGNAAGINGDGVADGFVDATFELVPGDYYLFVGGVNYFAQLTEAPVFRSHSKPSMNWATTPPVFPLWSSSRPLILPSFSLPRRDQLSRLVFQAARTLFTTSKARPPWIPMTGRQLTLRMATAEMLSFRIP